MTANEFKNHYTFRLTDKSLNEWDVMEKDDVREYAHLLLKEKVRLKSDQIQEKYNASNTSVVGDVINEFRELLK